MEGVFFAVSFDFGVHVFRGKLGGGKAESVESQRIFIGISAQVVVFSSGVKGAEKQFPVEFFFLFIISHGNSPSEILNLYGKVGINRHNNLVSETLPRFVYGV